MKILLLSHKFSPDVGGIESISEMLADCFSDQQHEVRVVTWSTGESTTKHPYIIIRKPGIWQLIRQHLWADIVFENNVCLRLSWPAVFAAKRSLVGLQTWLSDDENRITLQAIIKKLWLRRANVVVACSDAIRQQCWSKSIVIGNPYQPGTFRVLPDVTRTGNLVFVGRLVSDKGADLAIESFERLRRKKEFENVLLTIIGDGPEKPLLQKKVADAGLQQYVRFLGSKRGDELVKCLNEHRLMLVPSRWAEPFGIVALEGMACGCLPIVSDRGGLPFAVGNGGLTFQSGNVDALVNAICTVSGDTALETSLRQNAVKHIEHFSAKEIAARYLSLMENLQ